MTDLMNLSETDEKRPCKGGDKPKKESSTEQSPVDMKWKNLMKHLCSWDI